MADYTAYPTGTDVEYLLKALAYWPEPNVGDDTGDNTPLVVLAREQAAVSAKAAADEFEKRTGWTPFLHIPPDEGEDSPVARTFMWNKTPVVQFNGGLIAKPTIKAGVIGPDGMVSPTTLVEGTHYLLKPDACRERNEPYWWIQLLPFYMRYLYQWSNQTWRVLHFEVSGLWGYTDTLTGDAWKVIQEMAGFRTLAGIQNDQSLAQIGQDGFTKALDIVGVLTQQDTVKIWEKNFDDYVNFYRRPVI